MKVDKSLQEVWDWKNAVYEETKDMTAQERRVYSRKNYEEIKKKYHVELRKAGVPLKHTLHSRTNL